MRIPIVERSPVRYSNSSIARQKRYAKRVFGIDTIDVLEVSVPVTEEVVELLPFCDLPHFKRDFSRTEEPRVADPTVFLVAPMSGHYTTLLGGTVRGLLPNHDVYITDWQEARVCSCRNGNHNRFVEMTPEAKAPKNLLWALTPRTLTIVRYVINVHRRIAIHPEKP